MRVQWIHAYISIMGAVPEESEEPTGAQLVNNEREQQSFFFPTITKGPRRDLNSLGGKFGVHHYQKIVPQNAEWKTFRLVKYLVNWPRRKVCSMFPLKGL